MNTSKTFLLQTLSLGALSFLIMATTDAGLYRWVDATGKVHFSDKVPPKMANQGHSVLSQNGVEKKRALSAKERQEIKADEEKNAEETQRLALEAEKQKQSLQEKAKRDEYLLLTYDSKAELNRFYENKLAMLSGTADILVSRNEILEARLSKLKLLKTVNTKNQLKIDDITKTIKQYDKALQDNQQEVSKLKASHKQDYKRYSELTLKVSAK